MTQIREKRLKNQAEKFEDVILQAVDEALGELGESVREIVYFEVARNYAIKKEEIPEKFYEFILALRSEFGNGSKTLEALILEKLFGKIGSSNEFQKTAATMILLSSTRKRDVEGKKCK